MHDDSNNNNKPIVIFLFFMEVFKLIVFFIAYV